MKGKRSDESDRSDLSDQSDKERGKTMRRMAITAAFAATVALLAGLAGAEVSEVSDEARLDTRSVSAETDAEDEALNTRSFVSDWSAARKLNTKKIVGTLILMR